MNKNANFQVDPKLAELLGEAYKSTEDAVKELVDNAFDADADHIIISLPQILSPEPIITISDNGTGMKEEELRTEYLKIASSRFSRKGDKTFLKKRTVKGRKGIGKFSGLMVADIMEVKTMAGGKQTILTISKAHLSKAQYDLEKVNLPIQVTNCLPSEHGTTITLKGLNQNYSFPNPDKLKQMLIWDYGRVSDLAICVNDDPIGIQDYQGKTVEKELILESGITAKLTYTICDKPVKSSGLVYRVGNKIVGRPENFLRDEELIPDKLKRRVIGEIVCDDLEDFVTADWGAIVENSKLNETLRNSVREELTASLNDVFKTDMHLARQRYQQKINRELEKLPEFKRVFAEKSLQRVIDKFYGEPEEKVSTIISVMIDAIEKDYYWNVIQNMESSRDGDIEKFADALSEFGMLEMSVIAGQAIGRLRFLDELDLLAGNSKTLEATMHKALDKNLWIFGSEYSYIFSNETLAKAIKIYLDKKFTGVRANKRPDLFLGQDIYRKYLLIEFKRPSIEIGRDAERQALEYRDDLNTVIHGSKIEIVILGGRVDPAISSHNERDDVKFLTYLGVTSNARTQYNWLIKELNKDNIQIHS